MDEVLARKRDCLLSDLAGIGRVVVAYSGGVDSTVLAAIAHEALGARSLAVTAVSASLARRELDEARGLARRFGWSHRLVHTHEIERAEYVRNSPDRCYWCKSELFDVLRPIAESLDAQIAVGTNVDDLGDYRPGLKAASERGVRTPLADAGLTKAEIRSLARQMGLPTADKPASPCLASRFAYGVEVTEAGLRRIESAEEVVREFGFETFRVRDHGDLARIEVPAEDIERAAGFRELLARRLGDLGFKYVCLDLAGFKSGSLNKVLGLPGFGPPTGSPRSDRS
jgi:pyridinium-3,5-biscarboxylic acid mononucleotide sulfurtransferase